jgi:hypothetical protein
MQAIGISGLAALARKKQSITLKSDALLLI